MDERNVLSYGQVFVRRSDSSEAISGDVIVIKAPAMHPGDVLRLRAVDCEELRDSSLFDVIVFPQRGPRPHPNETSGGDLDGDKFFLCWDSRLLPPRTCEPADYRPDPDVGPMGPKSPTVVSDADALKGWFLQYLQANNLGRLASAHLATADLSELGAEDPACLKLARLCSQAVDFAKTGRAADFPPDLHAKLMPDFMERHPAHQYTSTKILGQLYRAVICNDAIPPAPCVERFDPHFLCDGFEAFTPHAVRLRSGCNLRLALLLDDFGVANEEDLFSGSLTTPKFSYLSSIDRRAQLRCALDALISDVRTAFSVVVDMVRAQQLGPGGLALCHSHVASQLASACYWAAYHPEGLNDLGFLSFPWLTGVLTESGHLNESKLMRMCMLCAGSTQLPADHQDGESSSTSRNSTADLELPVHRVRQPHPSVAE